jgi:CHAT domain-containing protein/Tfp pilus assembly protein PilF
MPHVSVRLPLCLAFVWLLGVLVSVQGHAQQPSRELQVLQDTVRDRYRAGAYAEALRFAEEALPLVVREYGAEHEQVSVHTHTLGLVSAAAGDFAKAERYYTQSLRISEKVYGQDSSAVAVALENLGGVFVKRGRHDAAEPMFQRALRIRQAVLGPNNAYAATGHSNLGDVALARGNWSAALASYRRAISLLSAQDTSRSVLKSIVEEDIKRHRDTFTNLCHAAWQTRANSTNRTALIEETFNAAQLAWHTSAASALSKMTARLGASDTELGRRIRQVQDGSDRVLFLHGEDQKLLTDWHAVQKADLAYSALLDEFRALSLARSRDNAPALKKQTELVQQLTGLLERCPPGQKKAGCETSERERAALGKEIAELSKVTTVGADRVRVVHERMEAAERALPGYQDFSLRRTTLRNDLDVTERALDAARAEITRAFPDYLALAEPKPLSIAEVQSLLRGDEALVAILVGSARSFVWAVSRDRADWAQIDAGASALAEQVAALRNGLDPMAQQDAEGAAGSQAGVLRAFDVERSHALYRQVLGPVATVLDGKRHVVVVPTGALTSLPFQVLVTDPPARGGSAGSDFRNVAWLIRKHALSVLPSVPSLHALRKLAPGSSAPEPFFGMGDPVLQGPDPGQQRSTRKRSISAPARYYRDGLADVRALREMTPLPDTAAELRAIAKVLKASPDAINLGAAASETRVKAAPLDRYRIIQFATHGLVAGDLSGLAEPALVLTPPPQPAEADDGLLTASEIAALKLDAEWVVLSACNTAAGAGEGAEALSGLARAFFYAGARALLVSHWAVYSEAAVELTTRTFETLAANSKLGRGEAFRQSMLKLIGDGRPPSYWAPFVIVGEAGSAAR